MATPLFIICAHGWEHDDGNYYQTDSTGLEPRKAYRSIAKAEADCLARNIESIKECWLATPNGDGSLDEYTSEGQWDQLVVDAHREQLFQLFNEYDVKVLSDSAIEFEPPDEPLPDEFFARLTSLLYLSFYTVVTVEGDLE